MKRRTFLKSAVASAAGISQGEAYFRAARAAAAAGARSTLPRRLYQDGIELSVVGFGAIVVIGMEQASANDEVARAVDRGVNYFDVAPSYGDGEAERKLGVALQPHRDQSFLACKTGKRDAAGAQAELDESLRRLKTDHFDLYQLHAMTKPEDVEQVLAPGGAMETFQKAREAGKVRYLGFSAHSEPTALALMNAFEFDSVLFPINYVCWSAGNFGPKAVALAKEKGVARLALKALAYTPWDKGAEKTHPKCWYRPIDDVELARKALAFTLTQGITAAIPPGDERIFRMALDLASALEPLSVEDQASLLASAETMTPIFRA